MASMVGNDTWGKNRGCPSENPKAEWILFLGKQKINRFQLSAILNR